MFPYLGNVFLEICRGFLSVWTVEEYMLGEEDGIMTFPPTDGSWKK
jgi:hypothetical protein